MQRDFPSRKVVQRFDSQIPGNNDGNSIPGWKRTENPQRHLLFIIAFSPVSHGHHCRRVDVGYIHASGADLHQRSHTTIDIAVDTDPQWSLRGLFSTRSQRDRQLARQLVRALSEQTSGKLQPCGCADLWRRDFRNHNRQSGMQAVTVISTRRSGEFNMTSTVVLAGLLVGKNLPYSSIYSARSSRLVRCVVTVRTLSRDVPAAAKIVLIRCRT